MISPQKVIKHYRCISLLGSGGMGEVFLAEDTRLLRKCALKILAPEVAREAGRLARFLQEARAASAFNHPNVAHIYEIGQDGDVHFLAMEYVEGRTLEVRMREGSLPLEDVLQVALQVVDALDAAHARGIVHRDIKPANLMLDERGHVKVLDFGLAKIIPTNPAESDQTQVISSSGALLGTVAYMSPEQALGRAVDGRSDLFSLGVVLYQMVTGRLPFGGQTSQETLARILREQPEPVSRFSYDLPPEMERIIRKCLEKDRERRYASARDLLVDLRGVRVAGSAPPMESGVETAGPLRAVVVDDEELARQLLCEYLAAKKEIQVVAECANGFEALKIIAEHKPDLVFLDVQMPKLDGFEVLELMGDEAAVIFVTAFDQYAIRAFEAHAVDYLLKPFSEDRLWTAVARARERLHSPTKRQTAKSHAQRPDSGSEARSDARSVMIRDARGPGQYLERVVVRDGAKVQIIPIRKLDYVEAQDDYIALFSEKGSYLKQQTISGIEEQLDPKLFVRIHRSYIVNLEKISRIEPMAKDSRVAVLNDGAQIPVSRGGYSKLKAALGDADQ